MSCPALYPSPRHWLTKTWLRLGKVAVVIVLAGLVAAGGMAFPGAKDAAAQSIRSGYAYTQRVCQEYGQQPRWYQVRDPIPGSDWRSGGGWAIVLERGGYGQSETITFSNPYGGGSGAPGVIATWNSIGSITADDGTIGFKDPSSNFPPVRVGNRVTTRGQVAIDRTGDGQLTAADATYNGNKLEIREWTRTTTTIIGGAYIRWANMRWCR